MAESAKSGDHGNERRVAGWAGVAFAVLGLIVVPLSPALAPPLGSRAEELAAYYAEHRLGFLVGNYLGIIAFLPGFVQLAILVAQIRRADSQDGWLGHLVLASGTCAYAVGGVVLIMFQALPFIAGSLHEAPAAVLAIGTLANVGFALFLLAALPFLLSVGWAAAATAALPRRFALFSYAVALVSFGASLGALWTKPLWLAAGGLATGVGFLSFFVWIFALAMLQFRLAQAGGAQRD